MMKTLLLLIFSFSVFAGEITCEDGNCDANIDSAELYSSEKLNDSYLSIKAPTEKVSIKSGDKTSPRNLKIFIDENNGKGLDVDMTSTKIDNDAANTIIFSDYISNLNFKSNGKTGVDAKTASYKCAQKVLSGGLGEDVKQDFIDRRLVNPSIPSDRCVADDLNIVKNNQYSCPEGFEDNGDTTLKSTRWVKKRKCRGLSQRKMCVEKKVKITCKWLAANVNGCNKSPPPNFADVVWKYNSAFCSSANSGFYAERPAVVRTEKWLKDMRKTYSDKVICNLVTDRVGKLNQYYKSKYVSTISGAGYNRQETATYNTSTNKMYLNMYYGRWYGSRGGGVNADLNAYIPSGHILKRYINHRGCYQSRGKYASNFKSIFDKGCGPGFSFKNGRSKYSFNIDTLSGRFDSSYPTMYRKHTYELCEYDSFGEYYCYGHKTVYGKYPSPGWWVTGSYSFIHSYYDGYVSGMNYKGSPRQYEGSGSPAAVNCYKSGGSVVCRIAYLNSYDLTDDEWGYYYGTRVVKIENSSFLAAVSHANWQVRFEVMTPVGSLMEIVQMFGVGVF